MLKHRVKKIIPFEKFGTALIPNKNIQVEIASAREEKYNSESRKPSKIIYTDLDGDLLRRDFTINAMAIQLNSKNFGQFLDPFNGVKDLEKKIIKTPHNADVTFDDDPLRMIRAIRFATQLNFNIENNTIEAIKRNAPLKSPILD